MFSFIFGSSLEGRAKSINNDLSTIIEKLENVRSGTRSFCDKLEGWAGNFQRNFFRMKLNWDLRMNYKICKDRLYELQDQYDEVNTHYRYAKLLQDDLKQQGTQPGFDADAWLANNANVLAQVRAASSREYITNFDQWMKDRIAATVDKVLPETEGLYRPEGQFPHDPSGATMDSPFLIWQGMASMASTVAISALSAFVTLDFLRRTAGAHNIEPPPAYLYRGGDDEWEQLSHSPSAMYGHPNWQTSVGQNDLPLY